MVEFAFTFFLGVIHVANNREEIFNMALTLAQESASVVTATENSRSANLCRVWYDNARRRVLKAGRWPCATTYQRLALLETRGTEELWAEGNSAPGKAYAYAEPALLLAPQYLHTYGTFDRMVIGGKQVIVSDTSQALLRYTFDQEDVSTWDEGLVSAVTTYMASLMCHSINGKLGLGDRLERRAANLSVEAGTEQGNEQDLQFVALPENVIARGYTGSVQTLRYFYPLEALNGTPA